MDKIESLFKENKISIILSIIAIVLYIIHQDSFFIIILIYGWFIKLLSSEIFEEKTKKNIAKALWVSCVIMIGLGFYVNHYMPHGPSYPTGDYVCANGDRGPCREEYKEDTRAINIPDWAKFVRSSAGLCLIFGLGFAGIIANNNKKDDE